MMTFEVGKKYISAQMNPHECVWTNGYNAVVVFEYTGNTVWINPESGWTEYKKPGVHKRFVFWWKHVTNGKVWTTVMFERGKYIPGKVYDGDTLMKVDTVSYTEIP
jgi:hypothetical protein